VERGSQAVRQATAAAAPAPNPGPVIKTPWCLFYFLLEPCLPHTNTAALIPGPPLQRIRLADRPLLRPRPPPPPPSSPAFPLSPIRLAYCSTSFSPRPGQLNSVIRPTRQLDNGLRCWLLFINQRAGSLLCESPLYALGFIITYHTTPFFVYRTVPLRSSSR